MLAPDEQQDLAVAMRPVRLLILSAAGMVPLMFCVPFIGLFLVVPISLLLFVLGYRIYWMNVRRIAEGKTSISVGRYGARAGHDHGLTQAGNVFYMVVGGIILVVCLTAPLRW